MLFGRWQRDPQKKDRRKRGIGITGGELLHCFCSLKVRCLQRAFKRAVARFPIPLFGYAAAAVRQCAHYAEKEETKTPLNLFFLSQQGVQIKIEALGASPSQPSPLTEDLN